MDRSAPDGLRKYIEVLRWYFQKSGRSRRSKSPKSQVVKDVPMANFILKNWSAGKTLIHFNGSYHSDWHQGVEWYRKKFQSRIKDTNHRFCWAGWNRGAGQGKPKTSRFYYLYPKLLEQIIPILECFESITYFQLPYWPQPIHLWVRPSTVSVKICFLLFLPDSVWYQRCR